MVRGILLAAGYGRRFDPEGRRDKLLVRLADGRPLIWHSALALCAALPGSVAVVRPGQTERVHWLRLAGCEILETAHAEQGMGGALAAAVAASADAAGWVIALADMPWLPAAAVGRVAAAIDRPDTVVAPMHGGRRGHPVGFGAAWGRRLAALDGDRGARDLLRGADVRMLDWHDDRILRDVDQAADLDPALPSSG